MTQYANIIHWETGKFCKFDPECFRLPHSETTYIEMHLCCIAVLKHLTWCTIKPHLIKGKLQNSKSVVGCTAASDCVTIYCFSLDDSLFSLRHLEFHFRFEKNRHFWRVIKQWNNQNKETRFTRTVIQFSHETKATKRVENDIDEEASDK